MAIIGTNKTNLIGNIANGLRAQTNSLVATMVGSQTGVNNIPEYLQLSQESAITTRRFNDFNRK